MREIKFRVWDSTPNYELMTASVTLDDIQEGFNISRAHGTVMQYTGLKDKNGKEIYEGDICSSLNGKPMGVVMYQAPSFVIKKNKRAKTWYTFDLMPEENQFQEVIGNIYENPELAPTQEGKEG